MNTPRFFVLLLLGVASLSANPKPEWIPLFDGRTLEGWRAAEHPESWWVEDGMLVTQGPRSHLFYEGPVEAHAFRNFELEVEVRTAPFSNSGIYVHTAFQEAGWPSAGYECQIYNARPPLEGDGYREHKMTGSIYAIRNTWKSPVQDEAWFHYRIQVQGKSILTFINGVLICEYTEPETPYRPEGLEGRLLGSGTIALQGHDPESRVYFRNLRVRILPDSAPTVGIPPEDAAFERRLLDLASANVPLVDLHTHLKGGLTLEAAMENARRYGFTYGIAVNCGLKMGFESDAEVMRYLSTFDPPSHMWHAMQAEGREWLDLFSEDVIQRFDYAFTDSMTWTNDDCRRNRLWIPEETEVGDPDTFMDQLVDRTVQILSQEPIQIWVNPTYLPESIADRYAALWTPDRMDRVIRALVDHGVALEINARRAIPSEAFLRRAKAAGVKFTLGTNNAGAADLGRLDYALEMIETLELTAKDLWLPE
jgi:hypothetical protein